MLKNIDEKNQLEKKKNEELLKKIKKEKLQERPKSKIKFTYIESLRELCDEKKKKSFDEYCTKSFNLFSNKINEFEDLLKDIKNNHWGFRSSLFETAARMFKTNHGKNKNKAKEIEEINNDALTFKQKTSAVLDRYFCEINNYKDKLNNFNIKRKEFLELLNKYDEKLNIKSLNTLTNMKSFNKLFDIKSFKKLFDLKFELDDELEKLKNTFRDILNESDFEIQSFVELGKQFEKKWNCTIMETKSGGKFIAFGKNVFEFSDK